MIFRMRNFPLQDEMIISNAFPLIAKPICPQSIHKNNKHADQSQLQIEARLISARCNLHSSIAAISHSSKQTLIYIPLQSLQFYLPWLQNNETTYWRKKKSPLLNWADNKSLPIQKHLTDNFPSNLHNSQSNITKKSNFPHARLKPWELSGLNISM